MPAPPPSDPQSMRWMRLWLVLLFVSVLSSSLCGGWGGFLRCDGATWDRGALPAPVQLGSHFFQLPLTAENLFGTALREQEWSRDDAAAAAAASNASHTLFFTFSGLDKDNQHTQASFLLAVGSGRAQSEGAADAGGTEPAHSALSAKYHVHWGGTLCSSSIARWEETDNETAAADGTAAVSCCCCGCCGGCSGGCVLSCAFFCRSCGGCPSYGRGFDSTACGCGAGLSACALGCGGAGGRPVACSSSSSSSNASSLRSSRRHPARRIRGCGVPLHGSE